MAKNISPPGSPNPRFTYTLLPLRTLRDLNGSGVKKEFSATVRKNLNVCRINGIYDFMNVNLTIGYSFFACCKDQNEHVRSDHYEKTEETGF